ncbi:YaaC family protein [Streptomyces sp. ME02-8801-2C]|uniref:YaaC family protein n=1 Tax=Streptomyces sp. ME02-8801-2C TaxID=3028680 RepID=UPI0039F6D170
MVRRPYPSRNDLTYPDLEDVWQALRETRSDPPGWAGSGNAARRKTYNAALEQAEQLLKAAAQVGPASRPLLLFYGLSQASARSQLQRSSRTTS